VEGGSAPLLSLRRRPGPPLRSLRK
jgi:hypothetical protein